MPAARQRCTSAARHLEGAAALAGAGDLAGLAAEAHTLISVTGSYGLRSASRLARELQAACKAQDGAGARTLAAEMAAAARRGLAAMRERFIGR